MKVNTIAQSFLFKKTNFIEFLNQNVNRYYVSVVGIICADLYCTLMDYINALEQSIMCHNLFHIQDAAQTREAMPLIALYHVFLVKTMLILYSNDSWCHYDSPKTNWQ